MLDEIRPPYNRFVYSPLVDAPYALLPEDSPQDEAPEPRQLVFDFRTWKVTK
jgi:hypothetical protein